VEIPAITRATAAKANSTMNASRGKGLMTLGPPEFGHPVRKFARLRWQRF
jgi:hypothetical protein